MSVLHGRKPQSADPLYSEFGLTFLDAKEDSGARTRHSSFDTNVLMVNEADFDKFIAEVYNAKDKYKH